MIEYPPILLLCLFYGWWSRVLSVCRGLIVPLRCVALRVLGSTCTCTVPVDSTVPGTRYR